jgi:hypothetical protein
MQDPLGKVKEPIEHNPIIQWLNLPHLEIDQIIQNYLSGDPNEKYTTGVGPQGFIAQDQAIQYTIDFENSASVGATAPLQELLVTDQLSSNLDWSTVQLESIHLGSWEIPCLAMNDTCMAGSALPDNPYPVRVEAALNRASGTLTWHVWSEDRVTGTLPEDPFAGFLPVNDTTGRGLGSVTFRVYPVAGQLEGTQIANQAIITFDPTYGSNPPISTASVVNTIDATGPSSFIIAAPTSPASYDVSWSGSDGSGSGVASFDIFVAIDDQPAEIWLTGNTGSGAVYTGMAGHTYKFLIWATDRVGNSRAGLSGSFLLYLPLVRR